MDDFNKILSDDDLLLWCQFLREMDMESWGQLSASGGWDVMGLRLELADNVPSVQAYFAACARRIAEPLSVNPGEAPRLRPALLRLLRRPAMRDRLEKVKLECLDWPTPSAHGDYWLDWLLCGGFSPVVRMGADDYGRTSWLEWRRQDGLTLHQNGADEPGTGLWVVVGADDEYDYLTPEEAILDAARIEGDAS